MNDEIKRLAIHQWVQYTIHELAHALSSKIRGWINYYGKFRISELQKVFRLLNIRLAKWARKKYKLTNFAKSYGWLKRIIKFYPNTFVHWEYGFTG
ncbi:MAG: group II intron maturase-specific domain-containing protein [Bacteroidales bacterium]